MEEDLKKDIKNFFPFYIISGDIFENKKEVEKFLEKEFDFSTLKNREFYDFETLVFPIEKAREIKKINSIKRESEESLRVFFIQAEKIEENSQNALLKVLEEPQKNTLFFLFLRNTENILKTLKSRARIIKNDKEKYSQKALDFLKADFPEREKMIEKIISKHAKEKEEKSAKIKKDFLELFFDIEVAFLEKINSKKIEKEKLLKMAKFYKNFLDLKSQVQQSGSGIKNIFIYLAIYLPKI